MEDKKAPEGAAERKSVGAVHRSVPDQSSPKTLL